MSETAIETKRCPYCAEIISVDAVKCKHCGEFLDKELRAARLTPQSSNPAPVQRFQKWSPGVAALLSFIIPGAGQMYKGDVGAGIAWFIFVILGYFLLLIPGLILHVICIATAASGDPYK